jgi:hypothetical protein
MFWVVVRPSCVWDARFLKVEGKEGEAIPLPVYAR